MSLRRIVCLAVPACVLSANAFAAGYQLNEQDATSVGMSLAGVAVEHNPAVQAVNPAGLANLAGTQIQAGANLFSLNADVANTGTSSLLGLPLGAASSNVQATVPVPYGYASYQIDPRWTVGFAVDAQIGLSTHYPDGWFGRYFALNSDLETIDLNPNVAFKITDTISVGAGIVARYTKARLTHAIDLGGIGFASGIPGSVPEAQDGIARLDADSWDAGFKLGADWHITPDTELGVAFRSEIDATVTGTANFTLSPPGTILSAVTGSLKNTAASAKLMDPATLNISLSHKLTPDLTLYADLDWVNWSVFNQLTVNFANPAQSSTTLPGSWQDTWKIAGGASYKLTPTIELRGGTAFESSPIKDAAHRTALLPDGDRVWLSGGIGWMVLPATQLNFGYAHLFVSDGAVLNSDPTAGVLRLSTQNTSVDIFSVDAVLKF
jgi:long-chain fatty acid transport protein